MRTILALLLATAVTACGEVTISSGPATAQLVVKTPERSAQFPGIYIGCDSRRLLANYISTLGVNQLGGDGPNYIGNRPSGCIVLTIAETSFPQQFDYLPSYDNFGIELYSVVQGGAVFYFAAPTRNLYSQPRHWDFGGDALDGYGYGLNNKALCIKYPLAHNPTPEQLLFRRKMCGKW